MSDAFAQRLLRMYDVNSRGRDHSRFLAERRSEMPTEGFPTDLYILVAPDDSVTVRLPLVGDHPQISRLVRRHPGGVFAKSAGKSIFTFPITDSDAPFIRKLYKALGYELKARSRQHFFNDDDSGWTEELGRIDESLEELVGIVEYFREEQDRAAEYAARMARTQP